jgi:hypothetical protein
VYCLRPCFDARFVVGHITRWIDGTVIVGKEESATGEGSQRKNLQNAGKNLQWGLTRNSLAALILQQPGYVAF